MRSSASTARSCGVMGVDSAFAHFTGNPSATAAAIDARRSLSSATPHLLGKAQQGAVHRKPRGAFAGLSERCRQLRVVVPELDPADDRFTLLRAQRGQRGVVPRDGLGAERLFERTEIVAGHLFVEQGGGRPSRGAANDVPDLVEDGLTKVRLQRTLTARLEAL